MRQGSVSKSQIVIFRSAQQELSHFSKTCLPAWPPKANWGHVQTAEVLLVYETQAALALF